MVDTDRPPGYVGQKVNPPLAYPGNKARLAPFILDYVPAHQTYVEVFGGTAGLLFNKHPSKNAIINDADGDVYNFLRVLKHDVEALQEFLRAQPYCERDYQEWKQRWHDGWMPRDDIVAAGVFYFLRRASFGSDMGGFRAEANGRRFSLRQFKNSIERLPELSARLDDVMLLNRDFEAVIEKYASGDDVFLFCDPPYKGSLHRYKASLFERGRFATVMANLEEDCHWMVSAATVPLALEPYHVVETDCTHQINHQDGSKSVTEKLVMNYDIDNQSTFASGQQTTLSDV